MVLPVNEASVEVKEPTPVPSEVFVDNATVGPIEVPQTTPLNKTDVLPSLDIFPPLLAPVTVILLIAVVVTVVTVTGITADEAVEATELPTAVVAITVKVYAVPFVKPVTFIGELTPVAVKLPGLDVTVYKVIALPPLLAGATNATLAEVFPAAATTAVGASGTVTGVTAVEAVEAAELPTAFVATTVKVYDIPFVKPVTVSGEFDPVAVTPPRLDVTV